MTDLELTKMCAEAMGLHIRECDYGRYYELLEQADFTVYDPLHDDTQAMALVKKHGLMIVQHPSGNWHVSSHVPFSFPSTATDKDLNRAIVECVAKMQASK